MPVSTCASSGVRCFPKPVAGRIPVVLGGNGDRALERVAGFGDGWYGFNVAIDEVPAPGGSPGRGRAPRPQRGVVADRGLPDGRHAVGRARLEELGVHEVVVVGSPPPAAGAAAAWVEDLAGRWGVAG